MPKMTPELLPKIERCRSMLYLQGYLTEAENEKVKRRIMNACDKANMKVKRVSILEDGDDD